MQKKATATNMMRDVNVLDFRNGVAEALLFAPAPAPPPAPPAPHASEIVLVTAPVSRFDTVMAEMQSVMSGHDAAGPVADIVDSVKAPACRLDVHPGHQHDTLVASAAGNPFFCSHAWNSGYVCPPFKSGCRYVDCA